MQQEKIQQPPAEELIDLRAIWNTINAYKWRLLSLSLLVTFIAGLVVLQVTPTYRATSTLLIESERNNLLSIEEVVGIDTSKKEYFQTQFEVLKSSAIAQRVVDELQLDEHELFIGTGEPTGWQATLRGIFSFIPEPVTEALSAEEQAAENRQTAIDVLRENLSISPIRNTQLVKISFESPDPELAARIADEVGVQYIEADLESRVEKTEEANAWLEERLEELSVELNSSENALNAFRQENDIVDVEGIKGLVSQELVDLSQRISRAEDRLNQAELVYGVIQANRDQPVEVLKNIGELASEGSVSAVNNELVRARAQFEELSKVYGPKHPRILGVQAQINSLDAELTAAIRELVNNAERDVLSAREEVNVLRRQLTDTRADYQALTAQESQYRRLLRAVETNRGLYDTFLSRIKETELAGDFGNAIARFTDRAVTPKFPVKPNKKLVVALAFVGTLGLGIVVVFLLDALNDTVRSKDDVEQKLQQRVLSALPELKIGRKKVLSPYQFFDANTPNFAEAVRTMRTALTLSKREKNSKIIAVTSTLPNEGKSTVSANLAIALGQMQSTLLIDADLRKPSLGKRFDIDQFNAGLTDMINGDAELSECIVRDEKDTIDILPAGQFTPNPLELLSSEAFATVLNSLREHYDRIIIDTPPAMAVSDPLIIAEHADAVLYVVKEDSTRLKPAQEGISRVIEAHGRVAGVVLNTVAAKRSKTYEYGYGYGAGYGDNYK
ncbi:GumC family protein [Salinibius halmophilus]|uniref:GumC family protein n=1 Tax=Salinibius halmophilus TaxID=1853216 RepID=UPI000E67102E|nr:polysaccharide biosynthesis tyrosine autokinase [Salinibius halmophilus]